MDGVLVIDKPEGPTSHDIVARVRRLFRESRVGHTGTLDPMATGVLPLVLGRATRLARFLSSDHKRYEAVIQLGQATDTYDRLGDPTGDRVNVTIAGASGTPAADSASSGGGDAAVVTIAGEAIAAALDRFRGVISQVPPPYSAKKIGGVSAHRLARRGEAVTPAPVQVTVHLLDLLDATEDRLTLDVVASAGFYVRSLAHDLGAALGCGAHLTALRRTASGAWTLADAVAFAECEAAPDAARQRIVPMSGLMTTWPTVVATADGERRLRHGQALRPQDVRWNAPVGGAPTLDSRDDSGDDSADDAGADSGGESGTDSGGDSGADSGEGGGTDRGAPGGEGPFVRVLNNAGDLVAVATPRPDGLLHPGLVLV